MFRTGLYWVAGIGCSLVFLISGCGAQTNRPQELPTSSVIKQSGMDAFHQALAKRITSAGNAGISGPGLVGVLGHASVKLLQDGPQELILPIPQMGGSQVPLCFHVISDPPDAAIEYRVQQRESLNDVVNIRLQGKKGDQIQIDWSSVVLLAGKLVVPSTPLDGSYLSPTACVQADAAAIVELADKLWPPSERNEDFARNIQGFIRDMKRVKQPRSLDAIGILDSGMSGICTANANLALALFRAKQIPSRSVAVIPPISQRLEMHRVLEYTSDKQMHFFDPSSLNADVPMKPWQAVIMARTSIADENAAMEPRMSAMRGCPYGQEVELLSPGISLWGQDFFWTIAKPLVEMEPDAPAIELAIESWKQYLQSGVPVDAQIRAAAAKDAQEWSEAWSAD